MQKVLIVDDDPDIRSLYRLVLRQEGLAIIEAGTGQEALSAALAENPALVLLDIMMPDMDGYEVCRQLRTNPRTASVKVLLFSAKSTSVDHDDGIEAGADGFITKSVGPRAVVARVRALLSPSVEQ